MRGGLPWTIAATAEYPTRLGSKSKLRGVREGGVGSGLGVGGAGGFGVGVGGGGTSGPSGVGSGWANSALEYRPPDHITHGLGDLRRSRLGI